MSEKLQIYEAVTHSQRVIVDCINSMRKIIAIATMPADLKTRQITTIRQTTINNISTYINHYNENMQTIGRPQIDSVTQSAIMADFTSRLDAAIGTAGISLE